MRSFAAPDEPELRAMSACSQDAKADETVKEQRKNNRYFCEQSSVGKKWDIMYR